MDILDLAREAGLIPKRCASTSGGEYKTPCPGCQEGKDRFCIWPSRGETGRYWCRVCDRSGDAIQFCRDFFGMSYQEACQKVDVLPKKSIVVRERNPFKKTLFTPQVIQPTTEKWVQASKSFIEPHTPN